MNWKEKITNKPWPDLLRTRLIHCRKMLVEIFLISTEKGDHVNKFLDLSWANIWAWSNSSQLDSTWAKWVAKRCPLFGQGFTVRFLFKASAYSPSCSDLESCFTIFPIVPCNRKIRLYIFGWILNSTKASMELQKDRMKRFSEILLKWFRNDFEQNDFTGWKTPCSFSWKCNSSDRWWFQSWIHCGDSD